MSFLRVAATDELKTKYRQLCKYAEQNAQGAYRSPLHQLDTNAVQSIVEQILGNEDAFRSKMVSDRAYRKLVNLFIRTTERLENGTQLKF